MEILVLLFLLQIKHWYADFKIQTYMQTIKKGIWLDPIGISHSLDHICGTLIALLVFSLIHYINPLIIILISLLEGITHYIIDYTKVKYGSKDMTKSIFWSQFGLDQFAHQFCYLLIAAYLLST
jgi:hypothetical protein